MLSQIVIAAPWTMHSSRQEMRTNAKARSSQAKAAELQVNQ
jgi:hypothetical protein